MSSETELANALYSLIEGARFAPQLNTHERQMRVDAVAQAIQKLIDEKVAETLIYHAQHDCALISRTFK